ncbi:hypothetical protein [Litoreibacter roseus]|nr:hypothetical protein [Litoreibacter roseus]
MTTALDGKIASLASAEPTVEAMVFGTENVTVYLRDGDELADGLCCVCSTDVDFGALMSSAREALSQIAAQP